MVVVTSRWKAFQFLCDTGLTTVFPSRGVGFLPKPNYLASFSAHSPRVFFPLPLSTSFLRLVATRLNILNISFYYHILKNHNFMYTIRLLFTLDKIENTVRNTHRGEGR